MKNNNVSGFHQIKLIQSMHQPPDLKRHLTKAEYGEVLSGMLTVATKGLSAATIS